MAYAITCAQCGQHIIYDGPYAIVHYSCGHVEHEHCYFDHHPQNIICLICGQRSNTLLFKPTAIEHRIASRLAKSIDPFKNDTIDDPLVRLQLNKRDNSDQNLIIHYTHEARLQNYKKHIHQLWDQTFAGAPATNTKPIIGNRNSPNATETFIRRRPHTILSAKKPLVSLSNKPAIISL